MYYKRKVRKENSEINLAPLMDVLTCTVGIMLFVVIFAVLNARGVSFKFFTPLQKDPPEESRERLFLCKHGKIKFLDMKMARDSLRGGVKFTYGNLPRMIMIANRRNASDAYFSFDYDYAEGYYEGNYVRAPKININEKDDNAGDDVEKLKSKSSPIAKIIAGLDSTENWISFGLYDEESLEVFREARNIAKKYGIPCGWHPAKYKFPQTVTLLGDGSGGDIGNPQ